MKHNLFYKLIGLLLAAMVMLCSCAVNTPPVEPNEKEPEATENQQLTGNADSEEADLSGDIDTTPGGAVNIHASQAALTLEWQIEKAELIVRGTTIGVVNEDTGATVKVSDDHTHQYVDIPARESYYTVRVDEVLYGDAGTDQIVFKQFESADMAVGTEDAIEMYTDNRNFPNYTSVGSDMIYFVKKEQIDGGLAQKLGTTTVYTAATFGLGTMGAAQQSDAPATISEDETGDQTPWSGYLMQETKTMSEIKETIAEMKD